MVYNRSMIVKINLILMSFIRLNNIFFLLCLILIVSGFISCTPSREFLLKRSKISGFDKRVVRVLIIKTKARILITSKSRIKISEMRSRKIRYDGKGKKIYLTSENCKNPIIIESWGSPLGVNGKCYRGILEIHNVLGKMHVINLISLQEYLYSVVPSEISSTWPIESMKAQAVVARTYACYHINRKDALYHLDTSTNFQVYNGISVESSKTSRAVNETSGEIVIYRNQPVLAFFHSTCGGITTDDKYVWKGDDKKYLKTIRCHFCKDSPCFTWNENVTLYEIQKYLRKRYRGIGKITGLFFKKKDRRVVSVVIKHKNGVINISGNDFRLLFPIKKIKSLFFTAKKTRDGLILHGRGWGHGVGMCQWGSRGMAEKGFSYRDIIKHYYTGIVITNLKKHNYAER